jgi:hypothetical protein
MCSCCIPYSRHSCNGSLSQYAALAGGLTECLVGTETSYRSGRLPANTLSKNYCMMQQSRSDESKQKTEERVCPSSSLMSTGHTHLSVPCLQKTSKEGVAELLEKL